MRISVDLAAPGGCAAILITKLQSIIRPLHHWAPYLKKRSAKFFLSGVSKEKKAMTTTTNQRTWIGKDIKRR
ncbi:MAG: hypothetical protein ACJ8DI_27420, partial [Ktedonobacteraceae bacterium]